MSNVTQAAPLYPFLAHPPPQKKRPTAPLPSPPTTKVASPPCASAFPGRRRSATTSAVAAWAATVHPGTPAPYSPRRSPSYGVRRASGGSTLSAKITTWAAEVHPGTPAPCSPRSSPSVVGVYVRRASGTINANPTSLTSFFDTPTTASKITPSIQDFKHDLAAIGYTSFFVNVQDGYMSPPALATPLSPAKETQRSLKSFKSLVSLRPARRARSHGPSSPIETPRAKASANKNKKPTPKYKVRPAPLANELALAQLIGGGSLDDHVQDFVRRQAKAAGAVKEGGQLVGVGDVYRDEQGNIWMDREEMQEHAHLLGKESEAPSRGWERFTDQDGEQRKSLSTQDSDLSPRYAMKIDSDTPDDLAAFARPADRDLRKPGMSVLAIPSRSRRAAKHLRKPEFLLNVFPVPHSPRTPGMTLTLSSPSIAAFRVTALRGKARRRPPPLKLVPHKPVMKCPVNPDELKRDFLEDSFAPPSSAFSPLAPAAIPSNQLRQMGPQTNKVSSLARPSLMNLRDVFKSKKVCRVDAA